MAKTTKKPNKARRGRAQNWMIMDPISGKITPSHRGPGSVHAFNFTPRSITKPDSLYRKILRVMDEKNIRGEQNAKPASEIIKSYRDKYGEPERRDDVLAHYLSCFYVWDIVDYIDMNPLDMRGGLWTLKPDVDINDADDLLERVKKSKARVNRCVR